MTVPLGQGERGLPLGLQLLGAVAPKPG